jgi:iron complex outermembrane receptor protein
LLPYGFGQEAGLAGTVSDASGARVRAATVTLQCGSSLPKLIHTDENGKYEFKNLQEGCTLQVDAPGFAQATRDVSSGQHDVDIVLAVQQASNSITVNADTGYVAVEASTGTKTDVPLTEVPQAISVVTRDQMDEQVVQSVPQALRYSAGMVPEIRGINGGAYETLSGRGFMMEEYLDGLRLPNAGAGFLVPSFDPTDLERIEILHGPASVLFGQAYPAGLVNLSSKQPRAHSARSVEFTPGSYDRLQGTWDFTGALDQREHFLYRLTGLARDTHSQVDLDEQERYMLAPSFTWKPDEKTSLTTLFNYQYDPHVGFYNLLPAAGTVLANPNDIIPTSFDPGDPGYDKHARRQYAAGYLFTRTLNNIWTIQQNFRYFHLADNFTTIYTEDLEADNRTLDRYSFVNNEHLDATTLDTHASATINRGAWRQTILMGVDYQTLPYVEAYGFDYSVPTQDIYAPKYYLPIARPAYAGDDHVKFWQTGVYGQDQLRYKRLAFTFGGREDWMSTEDHERISGSDQKQSDHAFTGRAGAVYQVGAGLTPYFSYSTSFQPSIGTDAQGNTFKPTTGQQYEAGVKYQPSGVNAFITLSAFNLTEQNVTTTNPQQPQFSVQTGAVRSRGIELEGHANLNNGLSLIAAYSLLANTVTSSNDTDSTYGINQGKTLYGTPRNITSFWVDYTPHVRKLSGFNLGSGARFNGRTFGDDADSFSVPSFTLIDATARYALPFIGSEKYRWQLSVNATNIADKRFVSTCIDAAADCFYGARRNVLGSVGLKW